MFGFAIGLTSGLLAFSFVEYALHRWGGHGSRKGVLAHAVQKHLHHHSQPTYFPGTHQRIGVAMAGVICAIVWPLAGPGAAIGLALGVVGGLFWFEYVHRSMHNRTKPPRTPYGRWVAQLHLHHHFVNAKTNHGITSPLWDWLLFTYESPKKVVVPDRPGLSPRWLLDNPLGPELTARFGVRGR